VSSSQCFDNYQEVGFRRYLSHEYGFWGLRTGVNIEVDDEGKRPDRHSRRPEEGEGRGEGKDSSAGLDGVMRS